ncbi:MAG: SDR family NAD(P)-dependent oxidoreductase [Alphaproteobacteria bacterium]|jgi:NAD(P)-dependent dehydrogenase (short-subunit alcohol dehydrogenase family)|nr:SDR family NAD(P)-dependent oxidoreductase [Alphaproteobacteria bacterium]
MQSLVDGARAVVVGAAGGIGAAVVERLARDDRIGRVEAWARRPLEPAGKVRTDGVDVTDEASIEAAAARLEEGPLDLVLVTTGVLHDDAGLRPEKSWRQLDAGALARSYTINAIGPALVAKHLLPRLRRDHKAVFGALSARVGSIEDNRIGGWYAYRASKAALNQILRTLAIELARRRPAAVCVGLHPGTTDTALSAPFQANVPEGKLFTPAFVAERLLAVVDDLDASASGGLYAWDGARIPF